MARKLIATLCVVLILVSNLNDWSIWVSLALAAVVLFLVYLPQKNR